MVKLASEKGIYRITLPTPFLVGPVNVYIIKGDTLTLVDTGPGTDEAWAVLKKELTSLGIDPEDIEQVIITHHHPDHTGMVHKFFRKARILGHWKNEPWLQKDQHFLAEVRSFFQSLSRTAGVPDVLTEKIIQNQAAYQKYISTASLTYRLNNGDSVPGLPGWRSYEVPGHAQSHIILYEEQTGIIIGGDHLLAHISSNAIIEAPYNNKDSRPRTLLQYRESLLLCTELPVSMVYPGHGDSFDKPHALIEKRLNEQNNRAEYIYHMIKDNPGKTAFAVSKELFPRVYQKQPDLTLSEVIGHLDLLLVHGRIKEDCFGDQIIYSNYE
ncbi:MBL fold metallo-hydrolase [Thalassorhabdus alkalitolerans]|uniref:MBL fold metallo-hydrolase n=2 Tax=Bacillaceae TaxID=186817 RepID=A0ABW0YRP6_9BACI